ncbi:MAG: N-acetylglutaminylglutamine synthetase [Rhodospirillaceae bacterium]
MAANLKRTVPQQRRSPVTLRNWVDPAQSPPDGRPDSNALIDCGWGRLLFAHSFESPEALAEELSKEADGKRDIAFYLRDPHVVVSMAPQTLFLDPSHTFRLWFDQYRQSSPKNRQYTIRKLRPRRDGPDVDRIYKARGMVPVGEDFWPKLKKSPAITILVAEDNETGEIIGAVFGVDHKRAINDPENGSSLWALAVEPSTPHSGVGEMLSRQLIEHFMARGRAFLDLSVMHDNGDAIALYEKLGFQRVPVFTLKSKNSINVPLFIGPDVEEGLNPYARIIVDEARQRGIGVRVLNAKRGYFRLTHGGQSIVCRESLSALTSAVAMSWCDDKALTREILTEAEIRMPGQIAVPADTEDGAVDDFLSKYGRIVVKPARGEQGRGVSVDIRTRADADAAIAEARKECERVLVEQFVEGQDLRIVVIGGEVVAAAVRRPAEIVGNGSDSARTLIAKQSRRREAATDGESRIPVDAETERCLREAGYGLDDVPAKGERVVLRKAANLHTGGTIHDVTEELHPALAKAAVAAAAALEIPVVGLDFLVPEVGGEDYVVIEANERPGLANHEPQPTAERFVDLLFPMTARKMPPTEKVGKKQGKRSI